MQKKNDGNGFFEYMMIHKPYVPILYLSTVIGLYLNMATEDTHVLCEQTKKQKFFLILLMKNNQMSPTLSGIKRFVKMDGWMAWNKAFNKDTWMNGRE